MKISINPNKIQIERIKVNKDKNGKSKGKWKLTSEMYESKSENKSAHRNEMKI